MAEGTRAVPKQTAGVLNAKEDVVPDSVVSRTQWNKPPSPLASSAAATTTTTNKRALSTTTASKARRQSKRNVARKSRNDSAAALPRPAASSPSSACLPPNNSPKNKNKNKKSKAAGHQDSIAIKRTTKLLNAKADDIQEPTNTSTPILLLATLDDNRVLTDRSSPPSHPKDDLDIICGKGSISQGQTAKCKWLDEIYDKACQLKENGADDDDETVNKVAKEVVQGIRDNGGRFLKKQVSKKDDKEEGRWTDIGDIAAVTKTAMKLRSALKYLENCSKDSAGLPLQDLQGPNPEHWRNSNLINEQGSPIPHDTATSNEKAKTGQPAKKKKKTPSRSEDEKEYERQHYLKLLSSPQKQQLQNLLVIQQGEDADKNLPIASVITIPPTYPKNDEEQPKEPPKRDERPGPIPIRPKFVDLSPAAATTQTSEIFHDCTPHSAPSPEDFSPFEPFARNLSCHPQFLQKSAASIMAKDLFRASPEETAKNEYQGLSYSNVAATGGIANNRRTEKDRVSHLGHENAPRRTGPSALFQSPRPNKRQKHCRRASEPTTADRSPKELEPKLPTPPPIARVTSSSNKSKGQPLLLGPDEQTNDSMLATLLWGDYGDDRTACASEEKLPTHPANGCVLMHFGPAAGSGSAQSAARANEPRPLCRVARGSSNHGEKNYTRNEGNESRELEQPNVVMGSVAETRSEEIVPPLPLPSINTTVSQDISSLMNTGWNW